MRRPTRTAQLSWTTEISHCTKTSHFLHHFSHSFKAESVSSSVWDGMALQALQMVEWWAWVPPQVPLLHSDFGFDMIYEDNRYAPRQRWLITLKHPHQLLCLVCEAWCLFWNVLGTVWDICFCYLFYLFMYSTVLSVAIVLSTAHVDACDGILEACLMRRL